MIAPSALYLEKHLLPQRKPVYQVELAAPVLSGSPTFHLFSTVIWDVFGRGGGSPILIPIELMRRLELQQSRAPLSTFTFQLQDPVGVYTASGAIGLGIKGWTCRFKAGFWNLQWDYEDTTPVNNIRLFTGIVTDVSFANGIYDITARSPLAAAQSAVIFLGAQTQLSNSINSALTTIPVANASAFDTTNFIVQIDNEIVGAEGRTDTTLESVHRLPVFPFVIPPLPLNGQAAAHESGSVVQELVSMGGLTFENFSNGGTNDMHPMDHFVTALTSANTKLGIGSAAVIELNEEQIAATREAIGAEVQFRFLDFHGISVKDFIELEICLPCAMWPIEDALGRISARLFTSESDFSGVDGIDDSHVIATPAWGDAAENIINMVIYNFDHLPGTDRYASTRTFRDEALIAADGRELPLIINSKGIRSQFNEGTIVNATLTTASVGSTVEVDDASVYSLGQQYTLVDGATSEVVTVSTVIGNVITLTAPIVHTFPTGSRLMGTKEWFGPVGGAGGGGAGGGGGTETFLEAAARRHIARSRHANVLKMTTISQKNLLEIGDDVRGNFKNVLDEASGTADITDRPFMVTAVRHVYLAENTRCNLELTEYSNVTVNFS